MRFFLKNDGISPLRATRLFWYTNSFSKTSGLKALTLTCPKFEKTIEIPNNRNNLKNSQKTKSPLSSQDTPKKRGNQTKNMENCNTFCILSSSKTGPPLILQVSPYGKNTSSWIIPHSDFTCLKSMDFSYCVDINVLSSLITRTLKSHFQTTLMSFTNLQILQFANVWSKCVGCLTSKGMSDRLGGTGVDW